MEPKDVSELYPPMYFGITNRLNFKDEYGYDMDRGRAMQSAEHMRAFVLEKSEFKEENREKWLEFFREHPNYRAAVFMAGKRTPG